MKRTRTCNSERHWRLGVLLVLASLFSLSAAAQPPADGITVAVENMLRVGTPGAEELIELLEGDVDAARSALSSYLQEPSPEVLLCDPRRGHYGVRECLGPAAAREVAAAVFLALPSGDELEGLWLSYASDGPEGRWLGMWDVLVRATHPEKVRCIQWGLWALRKMPDADQLAALAPGSAVTYAERSRAYRKLATQVESAGDGQAATDCRQRALADAQAAVALDPTSADAAISLALAKTALGEHQDALNDMNQLIEREPELADAYSTRAHIRWNLGDEAAARADRARAEELKQAARVAYLKTDDGLKVLRSDVQVLTDRVFTAVADGAPTDEQAAKALDALGSLLDYHPGERGYRLTRALLSLRLGQTETAAADLDQLLEEEGGAAYVHYLRAHLRSAAGDDAGAEADMAAYAGLVQQRPQGSLQLPPAPATDTFPVAEVTHPHEVETLAEQGGPNLRAEMLKVLAASNTTQPAHFQAVLALKSLNDPGPFSELEVDYLNMALWHILSNGERFYRHEALRIAGEVRDPSSLPCLAMIACSDVLNWDHDIVPALDAISAYPAAAAEPVMWHIFMNASQPRVRTRALVRIAKLENRTYDDLCEELIFSGTPEERLPGAEYWEFYNQAPPLKRLVLLQVATDEQADPVDRQRALEHLTQAKDPLAKCVDR